MLCNGGTRGRKLRACLSSQAEEPNGGLKRHTARPGVPKHKTLRT